MNNRGSVLMTMLLAIAVPSILMTLLHSYSSQLKAMQYRNELAVREDIRSLVSDVLSNPAVCSCQFDPAMNMPAKAWQSINTTTPVDLNLTELRSGCAFAGTNKIVSTDDTQAMALVSRIRVSGLKAPPPGSISTSGYLEIHMSLPLLAPIRLPINFMVDGSVAGAAKPIRNCWAPNPNTPYLTKCPTGYTLVGPVGTKPAFCIQNNPTTGVYKSMYGACGVSPSPEYGFPSLCFQGSWYHACKAGAFVPNSWEWGMDNRSDDILPGQTTSFTGTGVVLGGPTGNCEAADETHPYTESNTIRCCIYSTL